MLLFKRIAVSTHNTFIALRLGRVPCTPCRAVLNAKKKVRPERGYFKRARGQYMSSPRCSQLFNHESLAPNWSQHTTI